MREVVEAYIRKKSIFEAALESGVSEQKARRILNEERNRRGFSDVRLLYAENESEFVIGGLTGKCTQGNAKGVTQVSLKALLQKQCYKCAISGQHLEPSNASLDHVLPISKGGKHEIDNVQWVHQDINRMKGDMTMADFVEMCRMVVDNTASDTPQV